MHRALLASALLALAGCRSSSPEAGARPDGAPTEAPVDSEPARDGGSGQGGGSEAGAACPEPAPARSVGALAEAALVEASGMVASASQRGVLWMHNDSGDSARLFAVGEDGAAIAAVTLDGASAVDWEDIALGPAPGGGDALYVGDVGDNARARSEIVVYRVREPSLSPAPASIAGAVALRFTYPGGDKHDCEAIFVDARSSRIFFVTKDASGRSELFSGPALGDGAATTTLTHEGTLDLGLAQLVTGADITRDGARIVIRAYTTAWLYERGPRESVAEALSRPGCRVPVAEERQGEAIAFRSDGRAYLTTSEGRGAAIQRVDLP